MKVKINDVQGGNYLIELFDLYLTPEERKQIENIELDWEELEDQYMCYDHVVTKGNPYGDYDTREDYDRSCAKFLIRHWRMLTAMSILTFATFLGGYAIDEIKKHTNRYDTYQEFLKTVDYEVTEIPIEIKLNYVETKLDSNNVKYKYRVEDTNNFVFLNIKENQLIHDGFAINVTCNNSKIKIYEKKSFLFIPISWKEEELKIDKKYFTVPELGLAKKDVLPQNLEEELKKELYTIYKDNYIKQNTSDNKNLVIIFMFELLLIVVLLLSLVSFVMLFISYVEESDDETKQKL